MNELTSAQMIGGNSSSGRLEKDAYNTPENVTRALLSFISFSKETKIWEPAAGIGKMAEVIESQGYPVVCSDIQDYGKGYETKNFYDFNKARADHVITNPPFILGEMFIRKCIELDLELFCLLLKSTYWHASSRLELFNLYSPSYILPLTWRPDFKGLGAPTMEFSWVVWLKHDRETKYRPLEKPVN